MTPEGTVFEADDSQTGELAPEPTEQAQPEPFFARYLKTPPAARTALRAGRLGWPPDEG